MNQITWVISFKKTTTHHSKDRIPHSETLLTSINGSRDRLGECTFKACVNTVTRLRCPFLCPSILVGTPCVFTTSPEYSAEINKDQPSEKRKGCSFWASYSMRVSHWCLHFGRDREASRGGENFLVVKGRLLGLWVWEASIRPRRACAPQPPNRNFCDWEVS